MMSLSMYRFVATSSTTDTLTSQILSLCTSCLKMTSYQLWGLWSPFDESFQLDGYSACLSGKPDGTETIQVASPSDQEVALYLQDNVMTNDWKLLGLTDSISPEMLCYTLKVEQDTTAVVYKPQPVKLNSVDSVFKSAITTGAPKLTSVFHTSEGSAFTVINAGSPASTLTAQYKINVIVMIYRQLLRVVTLIYTAYQKCFHALQLSV
ncbi:LOW QUALITY PROTEIN: FANCD2 opposite strand protein-like [Mobula hypostoma]|uniref:LOW QUALITY PROTEIN: FANCD2 opposite strand protein-like n=1 Tax=Mobula hypostoma TaxID=723540 RepID=UPI002FC335C0